MNNIQYGKEIDLLPCPFCGHDAIRPIPTQAHCGNSACPLSSLTFHDVLWNKRAPHTNFETAIADAVRAERVKVIEECAMYVENIGKTTMFTTNLRDIMGIAADLRKLKSNKEG